MKELLHTPIFDVMELDEVEPGFKPVGIKAPYWVSIIVEKDNKFLVVKQYRYGAMRKTVEFPSGIVEEGEDPLDAAVRELAEETGLVVDKKDIDFISVTSPNPAFMMNQKFVYYVDLNKVKYSEKEQHLDEHEHIEYFWDDKWELTESFGKVPLIAAMTGTALLDYWNYKGLFNNLRELKCSM